MVPGAFAHQAWYHDSVSFCTPNTFNLTNGVTIAWLPSEDEACVPCGWRFGP